MTNQKISDEDEFDDILLEDEYEENTSNKLGVADSDSVNFQDV